MNTLIIPQWPIPTTVAACSTTRRGGVSLPPWDSLNPAAHCGDNPAHVRENRQRLARMAGLPGAPLWLNQVHGTDVCTADEPRQPIPARDADPMSRQNKNPPADTPLTSQSSQPDKRACSQQAPDQPSPASEQGSPTACLPQADASYSNRPGVVCAVMTADCLPVLFCAASGEEVAAAHAGWRGLCAGILERTVARFHCPPARLLAWLGPAIGPQAFEVGDDVRDAFIARQRQAAAAFRPHPAHAGKHLADLYLLARQRLNALGVTQIYGGDYCTWRQADQFFSWRRDGKTTGRMASLIWRQPASV